VLVPIFVKVLALFLSMAVNITTLLLVLALVSCMADKEVEAKEPSDLTKGAASKEDAGGRKDSRHRRHDLSSVQCIAKADDDQSIRFIVACPGVQNADLDVRVLDRNLVINGETVSGEECYVIDRCIALPSCADTDTIRISHANGTMAISFQKKVGKRIPVVVATSATPEVASTGEGGARASTPPGMMHEDKINPATGTGTGTDEDWTPLQ
jgi:HSP20 family molecular chaperone IbpA